jgi:DNA-directed RNA polymerase specialized sigma24 family protein
MTTVSEPECPRWPLRLAELCLEIQDPPSEKTLDVARAEAWDLLNASISKYLRIHCARLGTVSREDLEDIAAEKSLDLLRKAESGVWDISGRPASDIRGFLSKVARNGLVDVLREAGRRVEPQDGDRPEWDVGETAEETTMGTADSPDTLVERREFAGALRRCAEKLNPRSRRIWFFRVFFNLSSR